MPTKIKIGKLYKFGHWKINKDHTFRLFTDKNELKYYTIIDIKSAVFLSLEKLDPGPYDSDHQYVMLYNGEIRLLIYKLYCESEMVEL